MEFRLETLYLGAKRFLYEKKSKITFENKTIKIPVPVKNDEMTVVKIPLHLVKRVCLLNCSTSYTGSESMKAFVFLDNDFKSKPSMVDVIKSQLRAKNPNLFQHGMIFNPKSKKPIEKEFLIELFLCNNSFANLKLAFKREEEKLKKDKNWVFDNNTKAQTRLIDFLGEHGQVVSSDFFGKNKKGRPSSDDQNDDSKDDSLILISPPPKSSSKSGSSTTLPEKKANTASGQPKKNQSKTYPDQPSTSGLSTAPQTVPQRSSPPIISFSAVKEQKTPLSEVQNSKPTPKKRKQEVEELSISWNSNPSPKPPAKKMKESETICLSDDEDGKTHDDDDTPLSQVLAAGPELQGFALGKSSNELMKSPSRNLLKSHVLPRLSPPLNPEIQAAQKASLICSLDNVEKSSMLILYSSDQQIFKSISTELQRVNNKIGATLSQRIVDLLARNKELEDKTKQLSQDLDKANSELDEEKEFANELKLQNDKFEKRELVHKEENRKLATELDSQKIENRQIRNKVKKSADLLLQIQNM